MTYCSVKWCGKNSRTSGFTKDGISFHKFPGIPEIKEKWIDVTQRENWFPAKNSVICSRHFTPDSFECNNKRRRLFSFSVPTLYLPMVSPGDTIIDCSIVKIENCESIKIEDQSDIPETSHGDLMNIQPESSAKVTDTQVEELPPRKRVLKRHIKQIIYSLHKKNKDVKRLQVKNRTLKKKNAKIEQILSTLTNKSLITKENENLLNSIGVENKEIVNRQIQKTGHTPRNKYSQKLRAFALTLHFSSPKAYDFVRKTFSTCLPAKSTLRRWYQSVDGKPGFTKEAIDTLKIKANESDKTLYATIIFDEMAIRSGIEYHVQGGMCGHVSFGASLQTDCQDEAKEALVFLLVPINAAWKIPIGYFLINGINADQKAALVIEAIHLVEDAGIKVKAITFDGSPANITMAKTLGCIFEVNKIDSTFKNPCNESKIAVFLDPAHMIKLVRNTFEFYKNFQDKQGETISWQHLVNLHNIQKKEDFHLANRLRAAHIYLNSKILKASLATHNIFSKSVSDALLFYKEKLQIDKFQSVVPTVRFLDLMNDLFDVLDSHTHGYDLKRAVNAENAKKVLEKLDTAKDAILNMTVNVKVKNSMQTVHLVKSPRQTGFLGFCVCIESAKFLIQDLVLNSQCDLNYIPLHKISQDNLEYFFGSVRCHGGSSNNPSARQFTSIYKKLLTYAQIKKTGRGNSAALHQIPVLQCTSDIDRINITTRHKDRITDTDDNSESTNEYPDFLELAEYINTSEFGEIVIEYMVGYTVHALIKQIKCQTCVGALIRVSNTNSMQRQNDKKNKLFYGSNTVKEICRRCEIHLKRVRAESNEAGSTKVLPPKYNTDYFIRTVLKSLIGYDLFPDVTYHQFEIETSNHLIDLARCVIRKYVDARLSIYPKNRQIPKTCIRKTYM